MPPISEADLPPFPPRLESCARISDSLRLVEVATFFPSNKELGTAPGNKSPAFPLAFRFAVSLIRSLVSSESPPKEIPSFFASASRALTVPSRLLIETTSEGPGLLLFCLGFTPAINRLTGLGGPKDSLPPLNLSTSLPKNPPLAILGICPAFTLSKKSVPYFITEDFLITYSPGIPAIISVSRLPVPGILPVFDPPLCNPLSLGTVGLIPLTSGNKALNAKAPPKIPTSGINGRAASATPISPLVIPNKDTAKFLNAGSFNTSSTNF